MRKHRIRAERVDTACGSIGHMSVDEIRERLIGSSINVSCPDAHPCMHCPKKRRA